MLLKGAVNMEDVLYPSANRFITVLIYFNLITRLEKDNPGRQIANLIESGKARINLLRSNL